MVVKRRCIARKPAAYPGDTQRALYADKIEIYHEIVVVVNLPAMGVIVILLSVGSRREERGSTVTSMGRDYVGFGKR